MLEKREPCPRVFVEDNRYRAPGEGRRVKPAFQSRVASWFFIAESVAIALVAGWCVSLFRSTDEAGWAEHIHVAAARWTPIVFLAGTVANLVLLVLAFESIARDHAGRNEAEQAERAVLRGEERYRSLVEASSAIVWNTPASGEFESEQPAWSAFTGQSFEQLRGCGWLDAIHPDDRSHTERRWLAAVADRTTYEVEHRVLRHDGQYLHMLARAVPICVGTRRSKNGSACTPTSTPPCGRRWRCERRKRPRRRPAN